MGSGSFIDLSRPSSLGVQTRTFGQELDLDRVRRETPVTLQANPGLQVPAAILAVRREPVGGASVALRPIGRGRADRSSDLEVDSELPAELYKGGCLPHHNI